MVAKGFRIRIRIAEPAATANAGTYPESLHPRWRRFHKWSSHRRAGWRNPSSRLHARGVRELVVMRLHGVPFVVMRG